MCEEKFSWQISLSAFFTCIFKDFKICQYSKTWLNSVNEEIKCMKKNLLGRCRFLCRKTTRSAHIRLTVFSLTSPTSVSAYQQIDHLMAILNVVALLKRQRSFTAYWYWI